MTISNEIKAKVFGQYLGQKVVFTKDVDEDELEDITIKKGDRFTLAMVNTSNHIQIASNNDTEAWPIGLENDGRWFAGWRDTPIKLLLRPLSEITDEDAIELANMVGVSNLYRPDSRIDEAKQWLNQEWSPSGLGFGMIAHHAYQFLQSRGYDLPHYLLGGKTLKESGLAIYESCAI